MVWAAGIDTERSTYSIEILFVPGDRMPALTIEELDASGAILDTTRAL